MGSSSLLNTLTRPTGFYRPVEHVVLPAAHKRIGEGRSGQSKHYRQKSSKPLRRGRNRLRALWNEFYRHDLLRRKASTGFKRRTLNMLISADNCAPKSAPPAQWLNWPRKGYIDSALPACILPSPRRFCHSAQRNTHLGQIPVRHLTQNLKARRENRRNKDSIWTWPMIRQGRK